MNQFVWLEKINSLQQLKNPRLNVFKSKFTVYNSSILDCIFQSAILVKGMKVWIKKRPLLNYYAIKIEWFTSYKFVTMWYTLKFLDKSVENESKYLMTYSLFVESFLRTSISLRIELNCSDSVASVFKGVNSFKAFLKKK